MAKNCEKLFENWDYIPNFAKFFESTTAVGKFTEYKLPLKSMSPGLHEIEYKLGKQFFANMESSDVHDADLTVKLTVNHKSDLYYLHFVITGEVKLICDRCLDLMSYPIDAAYDIAVKYGDDYNDDSDELLEIPESDNYLNVAYMIYDTVELQIPMKHVHPMGKCNRAMSAILRKHRAHRPGDEDAELEDQLMDEIDVESDDEASAASDPRWDELKKLTDNNQE